MKGRNRYWDIHAFSVRWVYAYHIMIFFDRHINLAGKYRTSVYRHNSQYDR